MKFENVIKIQQKQLGMIRFDISFFIQDNNLQIELEIFLVAVRFKVSDNFFWLDEVHIDHLEETHTSFRFFL